jgi:hypothetical protein
MKCPTCNGKGYTVSYSRRRVGYTTCEHRDPCPDCGGTGDARIYTQEKLAKLPCPLPPEPDAQRMWDETPDREDAAIDALTVLAFRGECPHGLPQCECEECTKEE